MLDFITRQDMPVVLLIDDDMVSREVMATVLTLSGYSVHTAADGDLAVATLASGSCTPDVILMDAQMPGLSGVELIVQLRERSSGKVYVISASTAPDSVTAKADGFLLKPFSPETLAELMGRQAAGEHPAPPPGLDPAETVVNRVTLAQLREMMPEAAVKQIYEAIIADLNRRVLGLEAAIARRDWAEARRLGHAIKGGALMAGAVQVARLGELVEFGALEPQKTHERTKVTTPINQSDNSSVILADLRAAGFNLQRMLDAELKP